MQMYRGTPTPSAVSSLASPAQGIMLFSRDGKLFVSADTTKVTVYNVDEAKPIVEIAHPKVVEMDLSPKGSFLVTWDRPTGTDTKNLFVW